MPGPFPGMDPWLENRILWQSFHNKYAAYCETALNRVLPPQLVATTEMRIQLTDPNEGRPDVGIVNRAFPEEEHQAYLTIRDVLHQESVVTVIELLSPSNKRGRGYEQYRAKQAELLQSETSLVEIDLLRAGTHTVAVPESRLLARQAVWDYLVCVHDVTDRWNYRVWPFTLVHRLPEIPIPLGADFSPVQLDLQTLLDECYDTGRYGSLLRYTEPPEVPFTEVEAQWVAEVLQR
ncbi:DUF4058 family protein [Armatimonas sp.]|uniref:DUF4058 family protein n=1 Tax=Armatimonas sp. TaxID=1872638 RepID=UPI003751A6CA